MLLNFVTEQFNNREIAIILWVSVLMLWGLHKKEIRKSFLSLVKVFLQGKIIIVVLFFVLYISSLTFALARVGLWDPSTHLKDTIVWAITIAFVMVMNISSVEKDERFFLKVVKDSIAFAIVIEFIVGLYPFSLPIELILVPILVLLGGMLAMVETQQEYASLKRPLNFILYIVGILILGYAVYEIFADTNSFLNTERFIDLILPSILTILFLPFIYFFALLVTYENVFLRLSFRNSDPTIIGYAKRRIFLTFGFNFKKLNQWSRQNQNLKMNNKSEVHEIVSKEAR